jgi:hypothetical protein
MAPTVAGVEDIGMPKREATMITAATHSSTQKPVRVCVCVCARVHGRVQQVQQTQQVVQACAAQRACLPRQPVSGSCCLNHGRVPKGRTQQRTTGVCDARHLHAHGAHDLEAHFQVGA